jgi:hypothetical protein
VQDYAQARSRETLSVLRYWLVTKHENGRIGLFTIDSDGEESLPVFSSEEEAETFLSLWVSGTGWWVRETTAGELISLLYGLCSSVRNVALDPPGFGSEAPVDLLCLSQRRFVCNLMSEHQLLVSRRSSLRIEVAKQASIPSKAQERTTGHGHENRHVSFTSSIPSSSSSGTPP